MCRKHDKLKAFGDVTERLSDLGTCKRLKVGAIVFPREFTQILSIGYNGQPSGLPNDGCKDIAGKCGCVHAEMNAIIKLRSDLTDLTMLCTTSPCLMCASVIINDQRIERVIYINKYRDVEPLTLLEEAGVVTFSYQGLLKRYASM